MWKGLFGGKVKSLQSWNKVVICESLKPPPPPPPPKKKKKKKKKKIDLCLMDT